MGPIQTLDEFVNLLIRRRWLIVGVTLLGTLFAVMVGLSRPQVYEAGAVIQVESPLVTGAETGAQSARILQALEQRLTTRESLTALIDRHGLFADAAGLSPEQKVVALRNSIVFQSVPSVAAAAYGQPASVSALIVTARLGDADQAARVANDLAQNVLDLSAARQSGRAQETLQFYLAEEGRVAGELAAIEAELTRFRQANPAALPGDAEARRDQISGLEEDLRRLQQAATALRAEAAVLQGQARQRETDRRRLEQIRIELGVSDSQIAAITAQLDQVRAEGAARPEVDQQVAGFERRIETLQGQLDLIAGRRAEAETALRLEQDRQSEHFSLLERATIPPYPASGGGRKIAAAGAIASVLMALALAFLLDVLRPVLRCSSQMERALGIRPVVAIPQLPKPSRRR